MRNFLSAMAVAVAFASLAGAPAQAAQPYDWTGFYVGANVGGVGLSTDFTADLPPPLASFSAHPSQLGVVGGVFGGYLFQFHPTPIVLGLEADFQGADVSNSITRQEQFGEVATCTITGDSALDWQASVRGRVGYAMGRFQPYVTGGVQFGEFDFDNGFGCVGRLHGPTGPFSSSSSSLLTGWTVGFGLDYAITNSLMLQVEYRHEDFGSSTQGFDGTFPGSMTYEPTADMGTIGLAWHF